jgi:hypothetical protein
MNRGLVRTVLAACFAASMTSAASASAGHIDVTISPAPTHNMALANGVYSPTGDRAVLNVNDLMTALNAGNLDVTTGSARGKESGDIVVEAAFHWASGYGLTLDAFHSIRVNAPVTDAGAGALALTSNDGGENGHLQFGSGGNIGFWGLANALTINGQMYRLVNSVASLAAAISANPSGNYALAASYDASVDHTYKQDPIATTFEGNFEGLGNAISNVSIRMPAGNIGFFNTIAADASVSNFRLNNINIFQPNVRVGIVGGLAAESNGTLFGDEVSGIILSHIPEWMGGLIGTGDTGSITHCASTANVIAPHWGAVNGAGGLAGQFGGTITDAFSTGLVEGNWNAGAMGGLVGLSWGTIRDSHASGNVAALYYDSMGIGGLVGAAYAPIFNSYATGKLINKRESVVGGLVGLLSSSIAGSFATGDVSNKGGTLTSGGLVGEAGAGASVTNSYATGSIVGAGLPSVGGFVGPADASVSISNSYAIGKVVEGGGGFACSQPMSSNDYWDTTTSGTTYGICGSVNMSGITGLTTTQLQAGLPAGFDPRIWAEDRKINHGLPYLIANPPPR